VTTVDRALTPQLVEDFRRDGFVVVPGLLPARALTRALTMCV
jgi:hypothetical protein